VGDTGPTEKWLSERVGTGDLSRRALTHHPSAHPGEDGGVLMRRAQCVGSSRLPFFMGGPCFAAVPARDAVLLLPRRRVEVAAELAAV
jgi:hypothetical protein